MNSTTLWKQNVTRGLGYVVNQKCFRHYLGDYQPRSVGVMDWLFYDLFFQVDICPRTIVLGKSQVCESRPKTAADTWTVN